MSAEEDNNNAQNTKTEEEEKKAFVDNPDESALRESVNKKGQYSVRVYIL